MRDVSCEESDDYYGFLSVHSEMLLPFFHKDYYYQVLVLNFHFYLLDSVHWDHIDGNNLYRCGMGLARDVGF